MIWNQHVQKMENIEPQIHVRHSISVQMEFVSQILSVHMVSNSMELIVIGQAKLIAHSLKRTQSRNVFSESSGGTKSECAGQPWLELWTICHTLFEKNHFKNIIRPCQDGLYQVRGEPSQFYHCFQGVKFDEINCPPGLLFNEDLGVCDWPRNVAVLPVANPFECFDGIYTAWEYGWYWYCYDSQLYYQKCPEPLEVSFCGP